MDTEITLTTFTPAEVERITGLSTATQRDWRRRDYLPSTTGHARLDMFDMTEVWVLKMLSDRGVGPQLGKQVSAVCANGIAYQAMHWLAAYEGDHQSALLAFQDASPPIFIDPSRKSKLAQFEAQMPDWSSRFIWFASQVFASRRSGDFDVVENWFVWWGDNEYSFIIDLEDTIRNHSSMKGQAGPIIVLDLTALGASLLKRAKKPLVKVRILSSQDG